MTFAHRFLLAYAPLSPFRTGRQPKRDDRHAEWTDLKARPTNKTQGRGEVAMATRSDLMHRLVLVIDDDVTRIESIAVAVRAMAADLEVLVLDARVNRAVVSALQEIYETAHGRVPNVVIVRTSPTSWTTADVLAALRSPSHNGRVDAIVVAEGTREMLPVLITDFPGLKLLTPGNDVPRAVVNLIQKMPKQSTAGIKRHRSGQRHEVCRCW